MTLNDALHAATRAGLPLHEARMLLLHLLQRPTHDRAWLLAHGGDALAAGVAGDLQALVARRLAGEPVAYLVGHKHFHGLCLQVDARVLDPRDDTETLVDWALERLHAAAAASEAPRVLDLGTGSGAIALALARHCAAARVTAVDASAGALEVARANAQRLGLRVDFRHGDWLAPVAGERFALLVSNPPYIAEGDAHLPALRHEPRAALVSGADGLADIRRITAAAPQHLLPGGWLLFEHGWDQAAAVRQLLAAAGFARIETRCDLAGVQRCTGGVLQGVWARAGQGMAGLGRR